MSNSEVEPEERLSYIYKATNLLDGMSYIGQSLEPIRRINQHILSIRCEYFHNALRQYGIENFEWQVIISGPESAISDVEIGYIVFENTKAPNGYNLTDGGEGTFGLRQRHGYKHPCSDATKLKIRLSKLGKKRGPPSEETKRKISETLTGKKHSEERIANQKAFWENLSKEEKSKRVLNRGPYVLSEESRQRLIEANKNRIWLEESKQKLRDANLGKKKTKKIKYE
jgi:group I intron endonuclease